MSGFVLEVHPDDAATWKAMTGRDEATAPPVQSRYGMDHLADSAYQNGIRLVWRELGEGEDR